MLWEARAYATEKSVGRSLIHRPTLTHSRYKWAVIIISVVYGREKSGGRGYASSGFVSNVPNGHNERRWTMDGKWHKWHDSSFFVYKNTANFQLEHEGLYDTCQRLVRFWRRTGMRKLILVNDFCSFLNIAYRFYPLLFRPVEFTSIFLAYFRTGHMWNEALRTWMMMPTCTQTLNWLKITQWNP